MRSALKTHTLARFLTDRNTTRSSSCCQLLCVRWGRGPKKDVQDNGVEQWSKPEAENWSALAMQHMKGATTRGQHSLQQTLNVSSRGLHWFSTPDLSPTDSVFTVTRITYPKLFVALQEWAWSWQCVISECLNGLSEVSSLKDQIGSSFDWLLITRHCTNLKPKGKSKPNAARLPTPHTLTEVPFMCHSNPCGNWSESTID